MSGRRKLDDLCYAWWDDSNYRPVGGVSCFDGRNYESVAAYERDKNKPDTADPFCPQPNDDFCPECI